MKKFLALIVVASSIFTTASMASATFISPAQAAFVSHRQAKHLKKAWRFDNCKYQSKDGHSGFADYEVKLTIWCAAKHFQVSVGHAFCYASHESGFNEFAKNPYSSASGIFQVVDGTWAGWYRRYPDLIRHWELDYNRFNPRNSALVVAKQVRSSGWGPWSLYASYSC